MNESSEKFTFVLDGAITVTKNLFSHAVLLPLRSLRSRLRASDVHQLIRKVSEVREGRDARVSSVTAQSGSPSLH